MPTAITNIGQDRTALVVNGMFQKDLLPALDNKQLDAKIGSKEKTRIESIMNSRLSGLDNFITQKVGPRIEMFVSTLEELNSNSSTLLKRKKADIELKIQKIASEKEEELRAFKDELEKKYFKKETTLKSDLSVVTEEMDQEKFTHERAAKKLKGRLESRLNDFHQMTTEIKNRMIETLWTRAGTVRDSQTLLDHIPGVTTFMKLMENLAVESNDEILKCLLAGRVEESTDWFCDRCRKYGTVKEEISEEDDDDDATGKKKKQITTYKCCSCEQTVEKDKVHSLRSPFRMKAHEVVIIGDKESSRIMDILNTEDVGDRQALKEVEV